MSEETTRRKFLKLSSAGLTAGAVGSSIPAWAGSKSEPADLSVLTPDAAYADIAIRVTDDERRFENLPAIRWQHGLSAHSNDVIALNPSERYQEILGFGGAFTDATCYTFSQLSPEAREKLFHQLFHPSQLGLNVCRTCIGASDYSTELFSYNEGAPDPELKRFSIDHDRAYVLPMLRQARRLNPDLYLFSTPWSPPGWMKLNGSMLGGNIHKSYFPNYAEYFVKFLQAYAAEGVPIQAVTSQNEVDTDQDGRMPACLWGQEYEIEFVKTHLGPALKANSLPTKIWLLDHNYNLWGRVICELDDPGVKQFTKSVAWHGYFGDVNMILKVREAHPDAEMHWTEGGPDYTNADYATDWAKWGKTFTETLRNWCQSITAWNIALDERGKPNLGPFSCGGMVTIHSKTKQISYS